MIHDILYKVVEYSIVGLFSMGIYHLFVVDKIKQIEKDLSIIQTDLLITKVKCNEVDSLKNDLYHIDRKIAEHDVKLGDK